MNRDPLPVFSAGDHGERFWHRQGCSLHKCLKLCAGVVFARINQTEFIIKRRNGLTSKEISIRNEHTIVPCDVLGYHFE